jgi:hypothetical protein
MADLRPSTFWTVIGALAALALGILWWRQRNSKSPAERERLRRLAVNIHGRLTDGVLIDAPYSQELSSSHDLLFYSYRAAGVEYSAAQDVSALAEEIHRGVFRPGTVATVKYDPRRPSNSIIICELWSGLPQQKPEPVGELRASAPGGGLAGAA